MLPNNLVHPTLVQSALIYSPWVYFVAVLAAELPWLAISLLTGPVASYFLVGLSPKATVFLTNYLILFLLSFIFVLVAKTASHILPSFELAQVRRNLSPFLVFA